MPRVLAVCENGHFFPTYGVELGGAPYVEVLEATFTVGEDVPVRTVRRVERRAAFSPERATSSGDTLELLRGPERTVSELERLREILREAREGGASSEEVKSTVQREFPGWGQTLAKLLVPKTPGEFYGLLSLVVATIGVLLAYERSEQAKDAKPGEVINNITVVQQAPPVPGQEPPASPTAGPTDSAHGEKVGRNEPCPCGSGQKFKRCHGENGEKRYYERP